MTFETKMFKYQLMDTLIFLEMHSFIFFKITLKIICFNLEVENKNLNR